MTYRAILHQVWPIILANAAVPLLGFIDTLVIGNFASTQSLAALGISVFLFNLIFWSFGFLRMSTSAYAAQAFGAGNKQEIGQIVLRALCIALLISMILMLMAWLIKLLAFGAFSASREVESLAQQYFDIRIYGAPATLCLYAVSGLFIGLGWSKALLWLHASLCLLNAVLDTVFVVIFAWDVEGVAIGTVLAEYALLLSTLSYLFMRFRHHLTTTWKQLWHPQKIRALFLSNGNLFVRTWALLLGFFWFTESSARLGTNYLAASHLLLQVLFFCALVLDAFAYLAESEVGKAVGEQSKTKLLVSTRATTIASALSALGLAAVWLVFGTQAFMLVTADPLVLEIIDSALIFAVIYIALSFAAFQLDGIFIGASLTEALRNASVFSLVVFVCSTWVLIEPYGYAGLWLSFIIYVTTRALTLWLYRQQLIGLIPIP